MSLLPLAGMFIFGGKKIEPRKQRQVAGIPKPSEELAEAKLEVLSILNGLEFAG